MLTVADAVLRLRPLQVSAVATWTEDRLLPALRKSGVTNASVALLHTTRADGRSIRTPRVRGTTNLSEQRSEVTAFIIAK